MSTSEQRNYEYVNRSYSQNERLERYSIDRDKEDFKRSELEFELRNER